MRQGGDTDEGRKAKYGAGGAKSEMLRVRKDEPVGRGVKPVKKVARRFVSESE